MKTVQDYIGLPYIPFGRTDAGFDCWGIVRDVHEKVYGGDPLPSFEEIAPTSKRSVTRATEQLVLSARIVAVPDPQRGALASAWFSGVCIHIGICVEVDGRLWILDSEQGVGARLSSVEKYASQFQKVIYYVGR